MCGIVGVLSDKPVKKRDYLIKQRDTMRHRGPDDSGVWWSDDHCVGFAQSRLSIIDTSSLGHQPMLDEYAGLCIVLNGEIYNFQVLRQELIALGHHFKSQCDTEVVLKAYREWGIECLSHLNGMFAFAIYDRSKQRVFMARDRAGEKPLFYSLSSGVLRFTSELKGLMADPDFPRRIDFGALDCYLAMGYVPGDCCILQGVKKLPPAHALLFDLKDAQAKVWPYWQLPSYQANSSVDENGLLEELESLLADSVRQQMVADVPLGILLSGGVDSSLVTAMAIRAKPKIKTFTVRFPGHRKQDETEHARLIARHFMTDHIEIEAGESSVDLMPQLAAQFDEPIIDSSMIPTFLVSRLVKSHCTVAVGGDGGDELFGGYSHYKRLLWVEKNMSLIPHWISRILARAGETFLPVGFKMRNWLQAFEVDLKHSLPKLPTFFDIKTRRQLLLGTGTGSFVAEKVWSQRVPKVANLLERAMRMDFENYLPEDILVKVDRSSMLCSLEMRSPFLDYRLCEFAFSKVPPHLKATPANSKILLKKLATRLLPPGFDPNRKQGFEIPLSSWLQGGMWLTFFKDVLMEDKGGFFNRQVVDNLFAGQARDLNNSDRLFALVLFELWRREYKVSLG